MKQDREGVPDTYVLMRLHSVFRCDLATRPLVCVQWKMAETLGIYLSNPSVMAKITQFLKWLLSLRQGSRLAPHTPAEGESWEQTAQRQDQLLLLRILQTVQVWVLINTFMGAGNWGHKEKDRNREHDSIYWAEGEIYFLLFPIPLFSFCNFPGPPCVLWRASPWEIIALDPLPRYLVPSASLSKF